MNPTNLLRTFYICCFAFGMAFIYSCSNKNNSNEMPEVVSMDTLVDRATFIHETGDVNAAVRYMDSAFAARPHPTVRDSFYYFHYRYDLSYRMNSMFTQRLYADSMLWVLERSPGKDTLVNEYAMANFSMADKLLHDGNFNDAYKYYYKAKVLAQRNNDSCALSQYVYNIALALYKGEQYRKAISYFKEAFTMLGACGSTNFTSFYRRQEILDDIGLCYTNSGEPDSAIYYYGKTLAFIDVETKKFPRAKSRLIEMARAVVYGNLGGVYIKTGNNIEAEQYLTKGIAINSQKDHDNMDAQLTRIKLAALHINQKRFDDARVVLGVVREQQDSAYHIEVAIRWNDAMWQLYRAQGQQGAAFPYLLRYKELTDSMEDVNKKLRIVDLDAKVMNVEKQDEIDVLQEQDDARKLYLIIAVFGCIMATAVIFLIQKNVRESKMNVKTLQVLNERINEQKQVLQKTLNDLSKAGGEKDRILKAVSHDMRSPVNSAIALIDLLLMNKENLNDEQLGYIELMKDSCNNALSLTKDLLEIATAQSEGLKKEAADTNTLTRSVVELLRFKAAEKKQEIDLQMAKALPIVDINKDKIARVLSNLINNAIKFSPSGSVIAVKTLAALQGVEVVISDKGIGIPADMKDKIFDIFTEAKRFGTSGEQPYGLGLSISKQIIEAHNGKIWFESEPNKGATFHIYLPA